MVLQKNNWNCYAHAEDAFHEDEALAWRILRRLRATTKIQSTQRNNSIGRREIKKLHKGQK
jgi:hypothetical protein